MTRAEISASQRALVVLDDIDNSKQMELLTCKNWGGPGSKMIVTTRDKHVLNLAQIDMVYKMEVLEFEDALCLFSWHAVLGPEPDKIHRQQSKGIVKACDGLPLAIEAVGDLCGYRRASVTKKFTTCISLIRRNKYLWI
ncbi:disease resistance protein RPV1-like [Cryptomeria japonica]|uniref:disease resistance protein RPV1-like n=1 Tax=Cryptomeria japonica TaxID=3369 RepID=UPI0027DA720C|nr:disease resistance protein RPV1-like [Cryptomeria japonica]